MNYRFEWLWFLRLKRNQNNLSFNSNFKPGERPMFGMLKKFWFTSEKQNQVNRLSQQAKPLRAYKPIERKPFGPVIVREPDTGYFESFSQEPRKARKRRRMLIMRANCIWYARRVYEKYTGGSFPYDAGEIRDNYHQLKRGCKLQEIFEWGQFQQLMAGKLKVETKTNELLCEWAEFFNRVLQDDVTVNHLLYPPKSS